MRKDIIYFIVGIFFLFLLITCKIAKADPVLKSVIRTGNFIDIVWEDSEHPPSGGYDIIVNGNDPGTWRQTNHTYYRLPYTSSILVCIEVEARHETENRFIRSEIVCENSFTGKGFARLSWTPPTEREDGTALDNLNHYRIYFGNTNDNLNNILIMPCNNFPEFTVHELPAGEWFFAVTAVDADMRESQLSNIEIKVVGGRPQGTNSLIIN